MLHLLPKSIATPDVGPASPAVGSTQRSPSPILITEQEVVFSTAAAIAVPPATTRRRWLEATLGAAIGRIRILTTPPEPRPHTPRREPDYLQAARMSREMHRL
jgi:hypothetical protein